MTDGCSASSSSTQKVGCKDHRYIPDLIPARQTDASAELAVVDFRLLCDPQADKTRVRFDGRFVSETQALGQAA